MSNIEVKLRASRQLVFRVMFVHEDIQLLHTQSHVYLCTKLCFKEFYVVFLHCTAVIKQSRIRCVVFMGSLVLPTLIDVHLSAQQQESIRPTNKPVQLSTFIDLQHKELAKQTGLYLFDLAKQVLLTHSVYLYIVIINMKDQRYGAIPLHKYF